MSQNDHVAKRRQWWRPHWCSCLAAAVVAASVAAVNLMGESDYQSQFYSSVWVHGWPISYMVRADGRYYSSINYVVMGSDSPIPFDDAPILRFSAGTCSFDIFLGFLLMVGAAYTVEKWARWQQIPEHFSLLGLFAIIAWVGTVVSVYRPSDASLSNAVSAAHVVNFLAIGLAWYACFDVIRHGLRDLTQSPQTSQLADNPPHLDGEDSKAA